MPTNRWRLWYVLGALVATGALLVWQGGSGPSQAQEEPPLREGGSSAPALGPESRGGGVLVRFAAGARLTDVARAMAAVDGVAAKSVAGARLVRVRVPEGREASAAAALRAHPLVLEAGPNLVARAYEVPNDVHYPLQWHLHDTVGGIHAQSAWDIAPARGSGVVI